MELPRKRTRVYCLFSCVCLVLGDQSNQLARCVQCFQQKWEWANWQCNVQCDVQITPYGITLFAAEITQNCCCFHSTRRFQELSFLATVGFLVHSYWVSVLDFLCICAYRGHWCVLSRSAWRPRWFPDPHSRQHNFQMVQNSSESAEQLQSGHR